MDRTNASRTTMCCGLLAACAVLTGCGSGDGFGQGAGAVPLGPTFDAIQANIFTPVCEQCHSGATAPVGLRLDAANAYALLVGVPSGEQPGLLRVKTGDPDNSYLIQKLEGRAASGERMPAGLPPLLQSEIDVVRSWIAAGAQQGALSAAPIRVTSLVPSPGASETTLPAAITAVFDRELNAPSVTTATFALQRSGGDGSFAEGNEVAVTAQSVAVAAGNATSAVMNLTGVTSVNDTYRVTLLGTGAATILDLGGTALDGEHGGTFPSGNGTAGGDFSATFLVSSVQPTLTSIQTNVFAPVCSGCHRGGGTTLPTSIDLTTAASSHAALVNVASTQTPSLQRVTPGNPNDSYLIRKLEGAAGIVGVQMPRNAPPLDTTTITVVRQWISNGAQQ
jgi:hypothetical protein